MVNVTLIRPHLQQKVLQKFAFLEFSRFSKCSTYSNSASKSLKLRLPWAVFQSEWHSDYSKVNEDGFNLSIKRNGAANMANRENELSISQIVDEFPVRIHFSDICFRRISKETYEEVIQLLESGKIITSGISLGRFSIGEGGMSPEDFNQLLKVSQVKELFYNAEVKLDYFCLPEIGKIPKIGVQAIGIFPFQCIFGLQAETMKIEPVEFSKHELNVFLKEWHRGSRKIQTIRFEYWIDEPLEQNEDESIFSEIPYEIIWSKEFHAQSRISDMEELKWMPDKSRFYALKRGNDHLFVTICKYVFEAKLVEDPFAEFLNYVNSVDSSSSDVESLYSSNSDLE